MSNRRCAIYARKSQESEERQVQSIPDQVRYVEQGLAKEGIVPLLTRTEAKSAMEPFVRDDFYQLIDQVERGKLTMIAAWHPDRLSRNEIDAARICYLVRKKKLDLWFASYQFVNSPEGIMMLQMALSQSQYYSNKLSENVLRGLRSKTEQGWWSGPAPEGYLNEPVDRTIVPDPERLPVIRRAFEHLLTGAYTADEVFKKMNTEWGFTTRVRGRVREGKKTVGGKPISRSAAYRMFSNVFYAGYFRVNGEVHRGAHQPAITLAEFNRVQDILGGRKGPVRRAFAYNGLIRCGACGRAVTGDFQRGRRGRGNWVYYHCGNPRCPRARRSIREDLMEKQIDRNLRAITFPPAFKEIVMGELRGWLKAECGALASVSEQQRRTLQHLHQKRETLKEMRLNGEIDADEFKADNERYKAQIAGLEEAAIDAQAKVDAAFATVDRVTDFATYGYQTFLAGTPAQKREVVSTLGASYTLTDGVLSIALNPLLPGNHMLLKPRDPGSANEKPGDLTPDFSTGGAFGTIKASLDLALTGSNFPSLNYVR